MDLKVLQQQFMRHIYHHNDDDGIIEAIDSSSIAAKQRMKIYQQNVKLTLVDVLKGVYPLTCKLVDERFFEYAANNYIMQYPSTSGDLTFYGEYFAQFLSEFTASKHLLYLPDVANYEWLHHCCHHAADRKPIDESQLMNAIADKSLILHPSVKLIKSDYALDAILSLLRQDTDGETLNVEDHSTYIALLRPQFTVSEYILSEHQYMMLEQLSNFNVDRLIACHHESELFEALQDFSRRGLLSKTLS